MEAIESIAHTLRGGTTVFFFAWAAALYRLRRRSRLMQLIYCGSLLLGFEYLKDAIFLFPQYQSNPYWDNLVSLGDLLCVPVACSFCIEAVRPGTSTTRRILPFLLLQLLCALCYAAWPQRVVFYVAFTLALLQVVVTVGLVIVFAVRYRRLLRDNYSSIEQRDVLWIVHFGLAYFGLYLAYCIAFKTTTWLSESLFCVLICLVWTYLYYYSCRHRVSYFSPGDEGKVVVTAQHTAPENQAAEAITDHHSQHTKAATAHEDTSKLISSLAVQLEQQMREQKLYLDPTLTLADLADRLITNRTTLSRCLNQKLGKTFYDYVNGYRMAEACRLMSQAAARGEVIVMQDVSKQSGFNSVTSFNRYFSKLQGVTPMTYYRQLRQPED